MARTYACHKCGACFKVDQKTVDAANSPDSLDGIHGISCPRCGGIDTYDRGY